MFFAIAVALTLLSPPPTRAAVWRSVTFTAPFDAGGLAGYEFERSYDGDSWTPALCWKAPSDTARIVPRASGEQETLWVSLSEASWIWHDAGGTRLWMRAVDHAGNVARWAYLTTTVGPDTEWVAQSRGGGNHAARKRTIGSSPWAATAAGDSTDVRLMHYELTIDAAEIARLCRSYRYVAMRGARDSTRCP